MRSGRSYCGVVYNIVNHSGKQIAVLAGWSSCCVITHFKKSLNTGTMVRSCTFLLSVGFHTEVAGEWPYVCFV